MLLVLRSESQISEARRKMRRRGISLVDTALRRFLRRASLVRSLQVGDELKSWDVLTTLEFIENALPRQAAILDIGAYASEVPLSLARLGFSNVAAVDLNPGLRQMPHQDKIRYEVGDFMACPFAAGTFDAVTATSVIEHGYDPVRLLGEISRVLRPGGYFLASMDYWPEKIDTHDQKIFGMSWMIFSKDDILDLVAQARNFGLFPCGELDYEAAGPLVRHAGHGYTFGWLALRKTA